PATTGVTPPRSNWPGEGMLVISTLVKVLAWPVEASAGSVKPKSVDEKAYVPSSLIATVLSLPCGASLTALTLKPIDVVVLGSVSTPPLATPPLSCTWNRKFAPVSRLPLALAFSDNLLTGANFLLQVQD